MHIKIAAKVHAADKEYFEQVIKPLLKSRDVEYLGEIGEGEKNEFLGNAYALLFPIDWPEPFGLVMIEVMACGTPVIAFRRGSVPEVMVDGVTGRIVHNINEAVRAVNELSNFDRFKCRKLFEERYTSERMVMDYLEVYQEVINEWRCNHRANLFGRAA